MPVDEPKLITLWSEPFHTSMPRAAKLGFPA
jgi:hypothetical protein